MGDQPQDNARPRPGRDADDEPHVYALRRHGSRWVTTRRDFIAAAATAVSATGAARGQQFAAPEETQCGMGFSHARTVPSLAVSPDGTLLASCGHRSVKLWSLPAGEHIRTLPLHSAPVYAVAISADGRLLASTGRHAAIALWSLPDGELLSSVGGTGSNENVAKLCARDISSVAITPDGKMLAEASSDLNDVKLWSIPDLELVQTLNVGPVWDLTISPDGSSLAVASDFGYVRVWSLPQGREIITGGRENIVYAVAFSPDGRTLASADIYSRIKLWSMPDGKLLTEFRGHTDSRGGPVRVRALAFSPDGNLLASGPENTDPLEARDDPGPAIKLWKLPDFRPAGEVTGHGGAVRTIAFSPDGKLLASSGLDQTIRLWTMPDCRLRACLVDPTVDQCQNVYAHWVLRDSKVRALSVNDDATVLASVGSDAVKLWSLPDGAHFKTLEEGGQWGGSSFGGTGKGETNLPTAAVVSPDGMTLATGRTDGKIHLRSVPEGRLQATLEGQLGQVSRLTVSADGTLLIAAKYGGTIEVWSLPNRALVSTLTRRVSDGGLAVSPQGDLILAASAENSIRGWKLPDGESIGVLRGHKHAVQDLAISADGKLLASAGGADSILALWSLPDGKLIGTLKGEHTGAIDSVALSPDGRLVVAGKAGETGVTLRAPCQLELWSTESGKLLRTMRGHERSISALQIIADGSTLVSGDEAGRIRTWSLPEGETMACLFDVAASPASSKAVRYTVRDAQRGNIEMTYTLPAGSPMPAGSVCTCNVVAGTGRRSGSGGHYWYPN